MKTYTPTGADHRPDGSMTIFGGTKADERKIGLVLPIPFLLAMANTARRYLASLNAKSRPTFGDWKQVSGSPVHSARVETIERQTGLGTFVVLDEGSDQEIQLSLPSHEVARQLGHALIEAADKCSSAAPRLHN